MTPDAIRAAIAADQNIAMLVAADDWDGAAAAITAAAAHVVVSRMVSARGMAERMAGGPVAAEVVLLKLEGARDAMLASGDQQQHVLGSLLRRQLLFLAGEGLDFGSAALRGMLDQFVVLSILTSGEVAAIKAIAEHADQVTEYDVRAAVFATDGTRRV